MSVRYLIERNYDFSPVILSNGSKIAINVSETGNSCKIIYDPLLAKNGTRCSVEVLEAKYPKFTKLVKENQIQSTPFVRRHEENQVLKRRHYFDNTTAKTVGPLMRYSDKRYAATTCWELKSKAHSVQELSDKFEIYKDTSSQSSYKSSSRLIDRKLTLMISGRNSARSYFQNGFRRKCQRVEFPFRSQTIGVGPNGSGSSLNKPATNKHFKHFNDRGYESMSEKRSNGSSSRFSSTICIPYINQRRCFSSINLSDTDYPKVHKMPTLNGDVNHDNFGSTKSMESLFITSQQTETGDGQKGDKAEYKSVGPLSPVQDVRKVDSFHENIVKIKSLLRPVDINESFRFKNIHRLKKTTNTHFDKKINFFESFGNTVSDREDFKYCSLPGRKTTTINLGCSDISLSDA